MFALFPLIMELSKEKVETKKIGPEVEYYYLGMEKVGKKQIRILFMCQQSLPLLVAQLYFPSGFAPRHINVVQFP